MTFRYCFKGPKVPSRPGGFGQNRVPLVARLSSNAQMIIVPYLELMEVR